MEIKVIAEYFDEVEDAVVRPRFEAGIQVLVDYELLAVKRVMSSEFAAVVPPEVVMSSLRREIMGAIEQRLFSDFNRRD